MKIKFTELNSGYKGERRVSRLSPEDRAKAIIALTLVCAFVFVFVLSSVGVIPLDALFLRVKVGVSGGDERFPIGVNTDSTLVTDVIGESIIILTTENVAVYSPNGRMTFSQPHVYAKPGISIEDDRAIIFDRAGKGFMLINDKGVIYEGEAENYILTAEYGEDGTYALGTKSDKSTSAFTVYNKRNDVIFKWNCAYEYIVSIALSDNSRYAGVAVMGAENGEVFTTVQYFGFDYKEPLNTQVIKGASCFGLEFTGYNRLILLADSGVYSIERKAEKYEELNSYYSAEFNSCDFSQKGNFLVSLAKYGSENNFEINLYKPNGKLKTTISADYEIITTRMSEKYIFALSENYIVVYNFNGREVSRITYKGEAYTIRPTDDFVFIYSLDKISRCFSFGKSKIDLST